MIFSGAMLTFLSLSPVHGLTRSSKSYPSARVVWSEMGEEGVVMDCVIVYHIDICVGV